MKNNLIILMCNLPWNWSTDYTNQTAKILSQKNFVICVMLPNTYSIKEYFKLQKKPSIWKKKSYNLYLFLPINIVPFYRFSIVRKMNIYLNVYIIKTISAIISKIKKLNKKILWVFDHNEFNYLFRPDYFIIYDCVDYSSGWVSNKNKALSIRRNENKLLKSADLVVTISNTLKNIHYKIRQDIYIVPQGFRINSYKNKSFKKVKIDKTKPIIGYIGGINFRLDYHLLLKLVNNCLEYQFIFSGPIQEDTPEFDSYYKPLINKLFSQKNVIYIGNQPKSKIPSIIKQFDVCIIPYNSDFDFNKYCYPMKLFEYFYMGKPVISTPIEELKRFTHLVKIGNNAKEWKKHINYLLSSPWPKKNKAQQKLLAQNNSWEKKIAAIDHILK